MFHIDRHTAELVEGARIVEVHDSGNLVLEKDGQRIDVAISGYQLGAHEVVVELSTKARRPRTRVLAGSR